MIAVGALGSDQMAVSLALDGCSWNWKCGRKAPGEVEDSSCVWVPNVAQQGGSHGQTARCTTSCR